MSVAPPNEWQPKISLDMVECFLRNKLASCLRITALDYAAITNSCHITTSDLCFLLIPHVHCIRLMEQPPTRALLASLAEGKMEFCKSWTGNQNFHPEMTVAPSTHTLSAKANSRATHHSEPGECHPISPEAEIFGGQP